MIAQGRATAGFGSREIAITLIVLLAILAVLVHCMAARGTGVSNCACQRNIQAINMTIECWYFHKGRWPATDLSDIGRDRAYFPSGVPCCPVTGEPYGTDPETHRVHCRSCGTGRGPRRHCCPASAPAPRPQDPRERALEEETP